MIEKHIVLEDIDPVMFYGVNNAHLQMIKSLYPKLRIVARDNVIRVLGDEEEMAKVEEDIEQMRKHLLKYNMLNDEDIPGYRERKTDQGGQRERRAGIQYQWPTYQEPQRKPAATDRCLREERHGICRGTSRYR